VPTPRDQSPENRAIDWPAVVRILSMQVLVLAALAGAFTGYVNWSSDRAMAEFVRASEAPAPDPGYQLQSATRVQTVGAQKTCRPRG
jgi:hypothetical protein